MESCLKIKHRGRNYVEARKISKVREYIASRSGSNYSRGMLQKNLVGRI